MSKISNAMTVDDHLAGIRKWCEVASQTIGVVSDLGGTTWPPTVAEELARFREQIDAMRHAVEGVDAAIKRVALAMTKVMTAAAEADLEGV